MRGFLRHALRWAIGLGLVAGIAVLYHSVVRVNSTTVALTFLLAILAASTLLGAAVAIAMSLEAVLVFNYLFLPPVGTLTIADPQNWVALLAFLVVAVVGSHLSARAQREAREAQRRRRETERLYAFSQLLLQAGDVLQLLSAIPLHLASTFGARAAALYVAETGAMYRSGEPAALAEAALRAGAPGGVGELVAAVRLGVRPVGSFGLAGAEVASEAMEALGSLIAIALERARAVEQVGLTEAARESERLKSVLLDSVAHDFRTPLTAIKAAITGLLAGVPVSEPQRGELLQIIDQESDRLNGLIEEAAEMARLEAGELELQPRPLAVDELVEAALEECRPRLGARPLALELDADLPLVRADIASAKKVLVRLLENADQYSPREQPITIAAERRGGVVRISVADRGPGIEERERELIFDKFYRGREQRHRSHGTGMGLAIARAIAAAHGGAVALGSAGGPGSVFTFTLPVAEERSVA